MSNTIGDLIDALHRNRAARRDLETTLKESKAVYDGLETELMQKLSENGLSSARGGEATVSVNETIVPSVVDWEAFHQYIIDHDALYLLERRAAAAPYRELITAGEAIPGVSPFTRRILTLRTL